MGKRKKRKTPQINRNHKDTVFRMLFSDKENLLGLYNALNGSHYTDAEALEYERGCISFYPR